MTMVRLLRHLVLSTGLLLVGFGCGSDSSLDAASVTTTTTTLSEATTTSLSSETTTSISSETTTSISSETTTTTEAAAGAEDDDPGTIGIDLSGIGYSEVGPGTVETSALGGIRFELAHERSLGVGLEEHHTVDMGELPADSELLLVDRDVDGDPVATVDELVGALRARSSTLDELEPVTLGGMTARVFDLIGPPSQGVIALLSVGAEAGGFSGWYPPLEGRIWVSETDRGLVLITAEVFASAADLPAVIEQSTLIVETLEFIDLE